MTQPPNGNVPSHELVNVQWGTFLGRPYAIALETATAAAYLKAQHAGNLSIWPDLGGYRDSAQQMDLHLHPASHGSNLKPSQIRATGSTHGWGTCVDIAAGNPWFQKHCGEYGFVRESPAGETNHYRYQRPTWAPAPPPHDAGTRTMKANGSHIRFSYTTVSEIYATLAAGSTVEALTYVTNGELVNGSSVWYGLAHGWVAAGITLEGIVLTGLTDVTPAAPAAPAIASPSPVVETTTPPAGLSVNAPADASPTITPANPTIDYVPPAPRSSSGPFAGLIAMIVKLISWNK